MLTHTDKRSVGRRKFGPQHHNAVAKLLREERAGDVERDRWDRITIRLARYFLEDNPYFDSEGFFHRSLPPSQ